ncbi:MAG TPA: hypothetical protein VHT91_02455 [Kofleriaceae bacterium]|jgi:hypothetical protein|nr:hypothetical protein [Kofleriaceae bacterium]
MPGETAYDELRGHDELPTVDVAACLLRICRTRARELDRVLQRRHEAGAPYGPYLSAAEAIIVDHRDSLDPEFLHRRELEQIVSLLAAAAELEDLALRARDIATVLDVRRGGHFFSWFAGARISRGSGDPIPVPPGDVVIEEKGTARGLTPAPDAVDVPLSLAVPLDGMHHLRLCPDGIGKLEIVFDARYDGVVDALFSGHRIAAPGPDVIWASVIPSCAIARELTYDLIDNVEPPAFYRIRPLPSIAAAYRARLRRGLDIAAQHGASVIVLPELCCDAGIEEEIAAWFAANRSVALLIAGSRHLEGAGEPRRNRARVMLRGMPSSERLIHDKFSNFSLEIGGVCRVELIERPNLITIVAGRRWSFSPLICKDMMEPAPRRVLIDLRARAVLVASMSPKTDLYVTSARAMAQEGQILVFVSNGPHESVDDVAIFAQPRRGDPPRTSEQAAEGVVAVIRTNGKIFELFRINASLEES